MQVAHHAAGAIGRWAAAVALFAWASAAQAFSGGIATTSFPVPAQGCNFCHGGGAAPSVTLECVDCGGGPPLVLPLAVHEFKLTVSEVGLQDHAGLNVSAALGTLATGGAFAAGTQALVGAGGRQEITHTAAKPAGAGVVEFSFLWTAPAAPGVATLAAWGNAVNFNGITSGDAAAGATLNVTVAGDTPTPTDTPAPTSTPTPTVPTPTLPPIGCPAAPDPGCVSGFDRGLLSIRVGTAGKEKLVAKLLKGPALAQSDMGNPLDAGQGGTGTAYALCVYDAADALAGSALIDRAGDVCEGTPCWRSIGRAPNDPQGPGIGYRYKDGALAADGILKILYKGGAAGSSKVIVVGKGPALPVGLPAALQTSAQATVQVRSSDGTCLSIDLTDITIQDPTAFKAK